MQAQNEWLLRSTLFRRSRQALAPDRLPMRIRFHGAWTDRSRAPDCVLQTRPGTTTVQLREGAAGSASCNMHPYRHRLVTQGGRALDGLPLRKAIRSSASAAVVVQNAPRA